MPESPLGLPKSEWNETGLQDRAEVLGVPLTSPGTKDSRFQVERPDSFSERPLSLPAAEARRSVYERQRPTLESLATLSV